MNSLPPPPPPPTSANPAPPPPPSFNVLIAGCQRTGKTSLARLLLDTCDISPGATKDQIDSVARFVQGSTRATAAFRSARIEVVGPAPRCDPFLFSVTDSPGLELDDEQELEAGVTKLLKFIEAKFAETLKDESNLASYDHHIHLCIYLLDPDDIVPHTTRQARLGPPPPTSNKLSQEDDTAGSDVDELESEDGSDEARDRPTIPPLEIRVMRRLSTRVHVLPVIARSDGVTSDRLRAIKKAVRRDLLEAGLSFGVFDVPREKKERERSHVAQQGGGGSASGAVGPVGEEGTKTNGEVTAKAEPPEHQRTPAEPLPATPTPMDVDKPPATTTTTNTTAPSLSGETTLRPSPVPSASPAPPGSSLRENVPPNEGSNTGPTPTTAASAVAAESPACGTSIPAADQKPSAEPRADVPAIVEPTNNDPPAAETDPSRSAEPTPSPPGTVSVPAPVAAAPTPPPPSTSLTSAIPPPIPIIPIDVPTPTPSHSHSPALRSAADMASLLPFALISPDRYTYGDGVQRRKPTRHQLAKTYAPRDRPRDAERRFVRKYRWGVIDVLDPQHCDFVALRTAVLATHMKALKAYTHEGLYQRFKADQVQLAQAQKAEEERRRAIEANAVRGPPPLAPAMNGGYPPVGVPMQPSSAEPKIPRQRTKKILVACHFCRARKLKCDGGRPSCAQCLKRNVECGYEPVLKRRGLGKVLGTRVEHGSDAEDQLSEGKQLETTASPGPSNRSGSVAGQPSDSGQPHQGQTPAAGQVHVPQPAAIPHTKVAAACHFCRNRKTRCDGGRPACSNCSKRSLVCTYEDDGDHPRHAANMAMKTTRLPTPPFRGYAQLPPHPPPQNPPPLSQSHGHLPHHHAPGHTAYPQPHGSRPLPAPPLPYPSNFPAPHGLPHVLPPPPQLTGSGSRHAQPPPQLHQPPTPPAGMPYPTEWLKKQTPRTAEYGGHPPSRKTPSPPNAGKVSSHPLSPVHVSTHPRSGGGTGPSSPAPGHSRRHNDGEGGQGTPSSPVERAPPLPSGAGYTPRTGSPFVEGERDLPRLPPPPRVDGGKRRAEEFERGTPPKRTRIEDLVSPSSVPGSRRSSLEGERDAPGEVYDGSDGP